MKTLLTPRQVAKALHVSESSIKRWCDKGVIATRYTAGGHRRIPLSALQTFLRAGSHRVEDVEVIALPGRSRSRVSDMEEGRRRLTEALIQGDEPQCQQIVMDLFFAEHDLSVLCDHVLAASFHEIGSRWSCGDVEVYEERRGSEIALRLLHDLRQLIPQPADSSPLAIGGAVSGDQYKLANAMAELVLRDAGWNAVSLGQNLPFATIGAAIREHHPKLLWLSCSHVEDEDNFVRGYVELYDEYHDQVAFAVGGQALSARLLNRMQFATYCDNMQHFQGFARMLISAVDHGR